jgi:hypothetical protein
VGGTAEQLWLGLMFSCCICMHRLVQLCICLVLVQWCCTVTFLEDKVGGTAA